MSHRTSEVVSEPSFAAGQVAMGIEPEICRSSEKEARPGNSSREVPWSRIGRNHLAMDLHWEMVSLPWLALDSPWKKSSPASSPPVNTVSMGIRSQFAARMFQ